MSRYYPLFMDVEDKTCLVVGGGEVAERKVDSLLECGARVHLVSPRLTSRLSALSREKAIDAELREYRRGDVAGATLAIAATDSEETNALVSREAIRLGVPVNVVDDPQKSTFIVPSLVRRGEVSVAISTGGRSPALARRLRLALEKALPGELAELADLVAEIRQGLRVRGISVDKETWQDALDTDRLLDLLRQGKRGEAKEDVLERLARGRTGAR